jgi:DNA-binding MarR family transcriptional regulator
VTPTSSSQPAEDATVDTAAVEAVMAGTQVLGALIAESLAVAERHVSMPQLRVLLLAAREAPLNLTAVAEDLGVHPSNATRTCDRLVKAGLLNRRTSEVDRRHLDLTLTAAGRRLVNRVMTHRRKRIRQLLTTLSPEDRSALARSLSALAAADQTNPPAV